jgi:hypothetical protein
VTGPHDPLPPQKPIPPNPPIIQIKEGHIMIDVTQLEHEVNTALDIAEKVLPWASMFIPGAAPVVALLLKAVAAVRQIEAQLGVPTTAAIAGADAHLTKGAPNSPALAG